MFERNILAKFVGYSDVISAIGYPWISLGDARRLSLDVISPDVFYDRNSLCIISHMGNETCCPSGKNHGEAGCSNVISSVGYPRM